MALIAVRKVVVSAVRWTLRATRPRGWRSSCFERSRGSERDRANEGRDNRRRAGRDGVSESTTPGWSKLTAGLLVFFLNADVLLGESKT